MLAYLNGNLDGVQQQVFFSSQLNCQEWGAMKKWNALLCRGETLSLSCKFIVERCHTTVANTTKTHNCKGNPSTEGITQARRGNLKYINIQGHDKPYLPRRGNPKR